MRIVATLATLIALVVSTGCGDAETPENSTQTGTITYSGTGGLAGIDEMFTVHPDGSGRFARRFVEDALVDRFQLKPARLKELKEVLRELDFDSLDTGEPPRCSQGTVSRSDGAS